MEETNYKEKFAKECGIDKKYLSKKFVDLPESKFDYYLTPMNNIVSVARFYEILPYRLKNGKHLHPALIKEHTDFDWIKDIYGMKIERRREMDNYEVKWLNFFKSPQVYDYLKKHHLILMEKWDNSEENILLELYEKKYKGADEKQREEIRKEIKEILKEDIELLNFNYEKATKQYEEEKRKVDEAKGRLVEGKINSISEIFKGGEFFNEEGVPLIYIPNKEDYTERFGQYLTAMFMLKYKRAHEKEGGYELNLFRERDKWEKKERKTAMRNLESVVNYLISLEDSGVIHFDPRSSNILIKDKKRTLCDYTKICIGRRAVDIATRVHDYITGLFDLSLEEKRELFRLGCDEKEFVKSSIWVLLKGGGVPALLEWNPNDTRYERLKKKSDVFNNDIYIDSRIQDLMNIIKKEDSLKGLEECLERILAIKKISEQNNQNKSYKTKGVFLAEGPPSEETRIKKSRGEKKEGNSNYSQPFQNNPGEDYQDCPHDLVGAGMSASIRNLFQQYKKPLAIATSLLITLGSGISLFNTFNKHYSQKPTMAKPEIKEPTIVAEPIEPVKPITLVKEKSSEKKIEELVNDKSDGQIIEIVQNHKDKIPVENAVLQDDQEELKEKEIKVEEKVKEIEVIEEKKVEDNIMVPISTNPLPKLIEEEKKPEPTST